MMRRFATRIALLACLAASVSVSQEASAAPADPRPSLKQSTPEHVARAEALYNIAMTLIEEKNFALAARVLEKSNDMDPGMGTQFHLAACYEQLGRTALAWTTFTHVADEAKHEGQPEREKVARDRADAIKPRIGFIGIWLPPAVSNVPGLHIALDGEAIPERKWKNAFQVTVAVELGNRLVAATAPGKVPWRRTIVLEKAGSQAEVVIPEMTNVYALPPVRPPIKRKQTMSPQRIIAYGMFGVASGALTLGHVGSILWLAGIADPGVPMTLAGFPSGFFLAGAGALLSTAQQTKESPAMVFQLVPAAGPNGGLVTLRGQF